jgi:hypothetical protein
MAIETTSKLDVGAAFVRAYCEGDADGMRRTAHPDVLHQEVNPGGYMEVRGIENVIAQIYGEINASDSWETDQVNATAVGPKVRIDASVRFERGGHRLRYEWVEFLDFADGLVAKRTLACAGGLPD